MARSPRMVVAATAVLGGCTGGQLLPVDAGTDAAPVVCPHATVSFELHSGAPEDYCVGTPGSCSTQWLSIVSSDGAALTIDPPCVGDCSACVPVGCPASCAIPSPMPSSGVHRTWGGVHYAASTCGDGVSCASPTCAAAGQYVARMCAYRGSGDAGLPFCDPAPTPTCVEATFDWPPASGQSTVSTSIDDAGAGTCCPTGWLLYACTYPDGGAGSNCHNPALGCASSSTCGAGCDFAVSGWCGSGP